MNPSNAMDLLNLVSWGGLVAMVLGLAAAARAARS